MKRYNRMVMVLGLVAIAACGDNGLGKLDANPSVDAPSGGTIDAAIGVADAPTTTNDSNTASDATAAGPVTVTVVGQETRAPASGQAVAFLNADNSVVLETTTGSDGTATATMVAGGSVTVAVIPTNGAVQKPALTTFMNVSPGDQLVVSAVVGAAGSSNNVTVNVSPVDNAAEYDLGSSCSNGGTSSTTGSFAATFPASCTTADLYVNVYDSNQILLDTMFAAAQPLADGATIDLTAASFDAPISATTTVANIPAAATAESATIGILDGTFLVQQDQNGANMLTLNGTSASGTWPIAADITGDMIVAANWQDSVSGDTQNIRTRVAQSSTPSADFNAVAIPLVTTAGVFDLPSSTISWTESGAGTADESAVQFSVTQAAGAMFDIVPAPVTRLFSWRLVAPHMGATLTLPTLPTSFAAYTLTVAETVTVTNVTIASVPHGYDNLLSSVFGGAGGAGPLTTVGDVVISSAHKSVGP